MPDILVVTKADLGAVALRAVGDLHAALRSLGAGQTPVLAVSSVPPLSGVDELLEALARHRAGLDLGARRLASRRAQALSDFAVECGERSVRALGGRRAAQRWLAQQDPGLDVPSLASMLEELAGQNR